MKTNRDLSTVSFNFGPLHIEKAGVGARTARSLRPRSVLCICRLTLGRSWSRQNVGQVLEIGMALPQFGKGCVSVCVKIFHKIMGCFGDRRKSVVSNVIYRKQRFPPCVPRTASKITSTLPFPKKPEAIRWRWTGFAINTCMNDERMHIRFTRLVWTPEYNPVPNTRGNPRWHICFEDEVSREGQFRESWESTTCRSSLSIY